MGGEGVGGGRCGRGRCGRGRYRRGVWEGEGVGGEGVGGEGVGGEAKCKEDLIVIAGVVLQAGSPFVGILFLTIVYVMHMVM